MRHIAIVAATVLAAASPALAQEAGAPGATGVSGPLSGSNPGSAYAPNGYSNGPYGYGYNNGYNYNNGYGYNGYGYNNGYNGYSYKNGYNGPGWSNGNGRDLYNDDAGAVVVGPAPYPDAPGMIEGRAAAPDYGYETYQNPSATGPGYPRAGGTPNSQW